MQPATFETEVEGNPEVLPASMKAAVYVGDQTVEVTDISTPDIGPGEVLIRVEACGICHTDLKKIEYDLLPGPRVYGHETAGIVAAVGGGVRDYKIGDRVVAFHHIPCRKCFYCDRKLYAQCPVYKKVGITAGFEAAGGGFAQYVRVMDWIVANGGVEKIPNGVPFEVASLVEPVNTVHKAVVQANPQPGDLCVVLGQGPIGLMFTSLLRRTGALVIATDAMPSRISLSRDFGAAEVFNPFETPDLESKIKSVTSGRGADHVFVAVSAPGIVDQALRLSRPGAGILLFSQTSARERIDVSGSDICVGERMLYGCYSASVDLQKESARLVFSGELPAGKLISHRLPLDQIRSGFELARRPGDDTLKIIVQPQRWSW